MSKTFARLKFWQKFFNLRNAGPNSIVEIIHDLDFKDNKFELKAALISFLIIFIQILCVLLLCLLHPLNFLYCFLSNKEENMPIRDPKMQDCINACNSCISSARACLTHHMGEEDMKRCLQLCLDCIDICTACVHLLTGGESSYIKRVCGICADLCKECADECGKFDSEECKRCSTDCRKCSDFCRTMAA